MNNMSYYFDMQNEYLRITPEQHNRIREIIGGSFMSESINLQQMVEITEYLVGEVNSDWIIRTFNNHKYETKPLISLSIFMMYLIRDFRIGSEIIGKVPIRSFL
jgi:hypothetical protein